MASLAGQEPGTGEGPVRQARKCSQVCFADSAVDWTLLVAGKVSPEPKGAGDVLHRRHRRRRWLPARIMLVSKESGHHGMNAFDHRNSIDTRGNFGTSPSNGFWRCVAAPRSF